MHHDTTMMCQWTTNDNASGDHDDVSEDHDDVSEDRDDAAGDHNVSGDHDDELGDHEDELPKGGMCQGTTISAGQGRGRVGELRQGTTMNSFPKGDALVAHDDALPKGRCVRGQ